MTNTKHHAPTLLTLAASLFFASCQDLLLDVAGDSPATPVIEEETDVCATQALSADPDEPSIVKVAFLIDLSGSMQFTDQPQVRMTALRERIVSLADQPNALVSVIGFGSMVLAEPLPQSSNGPFFEPAAFYVEPSFLQLADVATSPHMALLALHRTILADALTQTPEERATTRYVVTMFTDGVPSPVCCRPEDSVVGDPEASDSSGCALAAFEEAVAGTPYCEGQPELDVCNSEDALEQFQESIEEQLGGGSGIGGRPDYGEGTLPALHGLITGGDYNRPAQLRSLVADIVALGEELGIGEISMTFTLLSDDSLPDAVKEIYSLNSCRTQALIAGLAEAAGGTTHVFRQASEIDFSTVDTAPLCP